MTSRDDWANDEILNAEDLNDTFDTEFNEFDTDFGYGTVNGTLNMPIGTILPWLKSLTGTPSLPAGWAECDGTGGTPDLNGDVFLRGTSTLTGSTGGANSHTHHISYTRIGGSTATPGMNSFSTVESRPPYYTVVWIIKIGV